VPVLGGFERREVWFHCSGLRCHGILYKPQGPGRHPGLIMGMGLGMVKEAHADDYAPHFASRGIAVLAFDYRRFGRSEGEPRQALYPEDQVADYRCAIAYMKSLDFVDPDRLCVWGTSFSGGHVIMLLAFPEPGLRCGIAQVPNVYSYRTALSYFGSLEPVMQLASSARGSSCAGQPSYIPIVSRGGPALLPTEEAYEYYSEVASRVPTFENKLTLDSIDRILAYNPGHYAHLVKKPLLIILASRDKTTPPSLVEEMAANMDPRPTIEVLDAGHFDIYKEPLLSRVADLEARWMLEQLGG
jgi:cephalosporin-C deacetylase-like acetyl esterase